MIIVQERLAVLFDTLPQIQGHKVYFGEGTEKYLNKWLKGYFKEGLAPYPLIWMLPSEETENELTGYVEKRTDFILCTRNENVDMFNPERLTTSFENVLVPLYNSMLRSFKVGGIVSYDQEDVTRSFHPNYSKSDSGEKNAAIDIWDAIKVTTDLKIYGINQC